MISQFFPSFKTEVFSSVSEAIEAIESNRLSFQEKYDKALIKIFGPGSVLVLPCNGSQVVIGAPKASVKNPSEPFYVRDGRYSRKVVDVYCVKANGKMTYHFYESDIRIQQIQASSGHHHAVLTSLIVPYERFTTMAALCILWLYFMSGCSQAMFCDSLKGINISVCELDRLIKWAKQMFPLLEIDVTPATNTTVAQCKAYANGIRMIMTNLKHYYALCVASLHLAMFQRKKPVFSPYLTGIPFISPDNQAA